MRSFCWAYLCAVFSLLFSCSYVSAQPLTLAVHPFLSAIELQQRFQPLCQYLNEQTGQQFDLKITSSYKDLIAQVREEAVSLAFIGPAPYIELTQHYRGAQLLAELTEAGGKLRGSIVVREQSDIQQLSELRGRSFAFVRPNSTMGCILPRYQLLQAGIKRKHLGSWQFLGNHENVAYAVLSGEFAAGAVKHEVVERFKEQGLRVLIPLPEVADHLLLATAAVDKELVAQLRIVLQRMHLSEQGRQVLHQLRTGAVAFKSVSDAEYDELRSYKQQLNTENESCL